MVALHVACSKHGRSESDQHAYRAANAKTLASPAVVSFSLSVGELQVMSRRKTFRLDEMLPHKYTRSGQVASIEGQQGLTTQRAPRVLLLQHTALTIVVPSWYMGVHVWVGGKYWPGPAPHGLVG
jgi:hypothetical protein